MLDPRETFQKYERRSPQPEFGRLACEYRRDAPPFPTSQQQQQPRLACEYRRDPEDQRYHHRPGTTTVTSYIPENSNKSKFPAGLIIAIAICIPIFLVIILFAAVWLQEVGIL